ncbi:extracellular solute-binding protein [Brevibacillus fluminis]|uniref:Extracellular solute-binding protein n=1 Tax=Brevibacillus fluminis TaxID=511487 RepID=A0A3M8DRA7_9BACL|nr:ABC transporter substrate-binding protein [Brevibacillus fluminis]RNB90673.1 extracellular solute-binding protein [Brevibacillus fluminis]
MGKGLKVSLVTLVAGLVVAGCSGGGSEQAASTSSTGGQASGEQQELVVVDWGGASSDAAKKAEYEPFEKKFNVKITVVSPTDVGKLKAMVESGNVEWDVVNSDTDVAIRLGSEGLLEKLDYSVINAKDVYPELVSDYSIGQELFYTNIGYSTELFPGDSHPKSWTDFWDTAKFPGPRSLYKTPMSTLEAALLADGVAPDKLYPLDVDRALKSLDKIKKDVKVWWEAGAQPPQLLSTKEVAASMAWNGRISVAKAQGSKIDNEFNQALAMSTSWVVPKGTPHKDLAMKFIAYVSEPEPQAEYSKLIDYAPTNAKALDLLSEDLKARLGQLKKDKENQVILDVNYWAKNFDEVNEKFNKWLLQ